MLIILKIVKASRSISLSNGAEPPHLCTLKIFSVHLSELLCPSHKNQPQPLKSPISLLLRLSTCSLKLPIAHKHFVFLPSSQSLPSLSTHLSHISHLIALSSHLIALCSQSCGSLTIFWDPLIADNSNTRHVSPSIY